MRHGTYRYRLALYLKSTGFFFLMTLAPLGLILQGTLLPSHTRMLAVVMLIVVAVWYCGTALSMRYERKVRDELSKSVDALGLTEGLVISQYTVAAHVIAMVGLAPIVVLFCYFIVSPPNPSDPHGVGPGGGGAVRAPRSSESERSSKRQHLGRRELKGRESNRESDLAPVLFVSTPGRRKAHPVVLRTGC